MTPTKALPATAAFAATLLLAGCSTTDETVASESPSPSASPTPTVTVDPEVAEVNALVEDYLAYVDKVFEDPFPEDINEMGKYAFLDAAESLEESIKDFALNSWHLRVDRADEIVKTEQHKSGDWQVWVCETRVNARVEDYDGTVLNDLDEESFPSQVETMYTVGYFDDQGYRVTEIAASDEGLCQW